MTTVLVPDQVQARINPAKFIQSNLVVSPFTEYQLATAANQVFLQRGKELFSSPGSVGASGVIPISTATRERWRFAAHTSTKLALLVFEALVARPTESGAAGVRLEIFDATGATPIGEGTSSGATDLSYSGTAVNDTPNELIELVGLYLVDASTEITGVISDTDNGRLVHAVVYELRLPADTDNGYFPTNAGATTPILDADRGDIATAMNACWKEDASPTWHFPGTFTTRSTTETNMVDGSSTSVSSSTPGVTLDERYKNRLSKTTVPTRMKVYGKCSASGGAVKLKDSGGAAQLTASGFTSTNSWITVDGSLPDTQAKYDLHYKAGSASTTFVGAHAGSFTGSGPWSVDVAKITVTAGETLIYLHASAGGNNAVSSPPSGWTLVGAAGNGNYTLQVWTKVATGSEPSTYSFGVPSNDFDVKGILLAYSGLDNDSLLIGVAADTVNDNGSGGTSGSAPSQTLANAQDLYLEVALVSGATSINNPSGMTERLDMHDTSTHPGCFEVSEQIGAAGATGTQTITTNDVVTSSGGVWGVAFAAAGRVTISAVSIYELDP